MISRRAFVQRTAGAMLLVPAVAAAADDGNRRRIGFLWDRPTVWAHALEGFRAGLRDRGWVEGRNITIEYRWAEGRFDRLPELAAELVRLKVEVIVAPTSIYTGAARRVTSTIPIVFASHADPIGSGHVASLARPEGNATGVTIVMSETAAKSLEVFKEAVPGLSRVAVIWDPATPSHRPALSAVEATGRSLHLELFSHPIGSATELDSAFASVAREKAGGVLVLSTPLFIGQARPLADLALRHRLPTMFGPREHIEAGGLFSYGPDRADLYHRAAGYVDQILRGARPGDLPVQQATKFELGVNLRTARAIGVTLSQSVLVRAAEIIE
jgi:putative ABC transport system substrate-binding protein